MTPTTLTFTQSDKRDVLAHRVHLRAQWADPWVIEPYLWPLRINWGTNQSIDTAELGTWRYGRGLRPDEDEFAVVQRLASRSRWYVRIELDCHEVDESSVSGPLIWYGIIENESDELFGVRTGPPVESGAQRWVAYGLEAVLQQQRLFHHAWRPGVGGGYNLSDTAPDFNADNHGNRSASKSIDCYPFSAEIHADGSTWSTRDIVEYLLIEGAPKNKNGIQMIPFELEDPDGLLPDTDSPVVAQEGRRTLEVLNELLSPSRLLGFWLEVDTATDVVLLRPFTYTASDVASLEMTILANPRQLALVFEADPDVQASLTTSSISAVDQVIARGARRRSVCSLSIADGNLEAAWEPDLQDEYDEGASADPDYPAASEIDERQRRDAEFRTLDRFRNVYCRLEVAAGWDGKSGDGFSGAADAAVFPVDEDGGGSSGSGADDPTPYPVNPRLLEVLPSLALLEGYDYQDPTTLSPFDTGPWKELPPAVFSPLPEVAALGSGSGSDSGAGGRWVDLAQNAAAAHVEVVQDSQARTWSVQLNVPVDDRAVEIRVRGAPQHALAYDTFVPLPHEAELQWGQYDFRNVVLLLTLEDQRWAEGRWPDDVLLPMGQDVIRRHYVLLGDACRVDYVVPDTMVGLDPLTGKPVISDGGYLRDDRLKLFSIAFAAHEYLKVPRRALSLRCHRILDCIGIGDYVQSIGDEFPLAVNSVVTSIEIAFGESDGATVGPPEMTVQTGFAEVDAIRWF